MPAMIIETGEMRVADGDMTRDERIAAREELVLGQPPRLTPLGLDQLSESALDLVGRMRQIGSGRPRPTSMDEIPEILAIMLRHADLYERQADLSIQLGARGSLSFRDRELVILRVGWLCQAPFEWGEHVKRGKQAGLVDDEIERITEGASAAGWSELDAALLRAVDELFAEAMISDGTWAVLARHLDEKQLIELPVLIGQYQAIAYSQNSLRIRLGEGNAGLKAR